MSDPSSTPPLESHAFAQCRYVLRLHAEDGTLREIERPCPYLAACRERGQGCGRTQLELGLTGEVEPIPPAGPPAR